MCGLIGGYGEPSDAGLAALAHRGPDAHAIVRLGRAWLGHTRLAILDLDPRSDQPFRRGPLTLVYNGEAWNYVEVREELRALGEVFVTSGDTEVVAAALLRWGPEAALLRLDWMGALAWVVDGEDVLRLARDRFGEVPLHVSAALPFRFASELKALLAAGCVPRSFVDVGPGELWEVSERRIERRTRWYDPPVVPDLGATALLTGDWYAYRHDLVLSQARKNFPRANKAFLSRGVECRLPFLHPPLVERALSLPRHVVQNFHGAPSQHRKAIMSEAYRGVLPDKVVDRRKTPFQVGLGQDAHIARVLPDPRRFYAAEYRGAFGG